MGGALDQFDRSFFYHMHFGELGQYIADYKKCLSKIKFWFISDVRAKCTHFRIMGNGTKPSLKNEIC